MLMRDEDVPQRRQRYACEDQLPRNTVPAIDDSREITRALPQLPSVIRLARSACYTFTS
jgi:hypothetical protein